MRSPRLLAAGLLALASLALGVTAAATAFDVEDPTAASHPETEQPASVDSSPDAPAPETEQRTSVDSSPDAPAPETPDRPGTDRGADRGSAVDSAEAVTPPPSDVRVPSVGIDAELEPVGVDDDRRLVVPPPERAGWFEDRALPGETGPAVLVGHVDSREGPAVFHGLDRVEQGDLIEVTDEDGDHIEFSVERTEVVAKSDFPTSEVYDEADRAELRLITCGGPFDSGTRSYRDNVIVYAVATDEDGTGAS